MVSRKRSAWLSGLSYGVLPFRVFNFLSDGELQEGATWEAAMAAANFKLSGLTAIVDMNDMQADGPVSGVMTVEPVVAEMGSVRMARASRRRQLD